MRDDIKEFKKELKKINTRIDMLTKANLEVPKELYERMRTLEELIEKWKKQN